MIKHLIGIALLTLVVLVVGGFGIYLAGSPAENRKIRYDEIRLRDIGRIKAAIDSYYQDHYQLPTATTQLLDNRVKTGVPYLKKEPKDPKAKINYTYRVINTGQYELCATFETSSEAIAQRRTGIAQNLNDYSYYGEDNSHPEGIYCFKYTPPNYLQKQQDRNDYTDESQDNESNPSPEIINFEESTSSAF